MEEQIIISYALFISKNYRYKVKLFLFFWIICFGSHSFLICYMHYTYIDNASYLRTINIGLLPIGRRGNNPTNLSFDSTKIVEKSSIGAQINIILAFSLWCTFTRTQNTRLHLWHFQLHILPPSVPRNHAHNKIVRGKIETLWSVFLFHRTIAQWNTLRPHLKAYMRIIITITLNFSPRWCASLNNGKSLNAFSDAWF